VNVAKAGLDRLLSGYLGTLIEIDPNVGAATVHARGSRELIYAKASECCSRERLLSD
jgi:hypothetical protein